MLPEASAFAAGVFLSNKKEIARQGERFVTLKTLKL
jgi:hypothetical protein